MKKIECLVSDEKMEEIERICQKEGYTRAEFMRRTIDNYINRPNFYISTNNGFCSLGIPSWAKPLPKKLDIGKRIRIKRDSSWIGREGIVTQHYINADDCGDYGSHTYQIKGDDGQSFCIRVENCEIIP